MDRAHPAFEAAAIEAMARMEAEAAMPAINAIKAIPAYLVGTSVIADLAAALATLAGNLPSEAKDVAQGYLDDLHDDMRGYAND